MAKNNDKSTLASKTRSLHENKQMKELSLWVISDEETKNMKSGLRLIYKRRTHSFLAFDGQRSVVVQRPVFHPNTIDETKPM